MTATHTIFIEARKKKPHPSLRTTRRCCTHLTTYTGYISVLCTADKDICKHAQYFLCSKGPIWQNIFFCWTITSVRSLSMILFFSTYLFNCKTKYEKLKHWLTDGLMLIKHKTLSWMCASPMFMKTGVWLVNSSKRLCVHASATGGLVSSLSWWTVTLFVISWKVITLMKPLIKVLYPPKSGILFALLQTLWVRTVAQKVLEAGSSFAP